MVPPVSGIYTAINDVFLDHSKFLSLIFFGIYTIHGDEARPQKVALMRRIVKIKERYHGII